MPVGRTGKMAERRIDIQPAEDEGDAKDDSVSVKHVARARYMRNQGLNSIRAIFSSSFS